MSVFHRPRLLAVRPDQACWLWPWGLCGLLPHTPFSWGSCHCQWPWWRLCLCYLDIILCGCSVIVFGCKPGRHYLKLLFLLASPSLLSSWVFSDISSNLLLCWEKEIALGDSDEREQARMTPACPWVNALRKWAGSLSTGLLGKPFWSTVVSNRIRRVEELLRNE